MEVYAVNRPKTTAPTLLPWRRATFYYDALRYAERGWRVFPLHSVDEEGRCTCGEPECRIILGERTDAGKHPRISGWPQAATNDA